LPEVAEEQGWDQRTTIEELVEKAGYRNGLDNLAGRIKANTYESLKIKMSYQEYIAFKKNKGGESTI